MAFPVHSIVTRTVTADDGFGAARIEPADEVIAGSYGTWRLTYEAGTNGAAVGGRLRVRTDSDTDWGIPQFFDPTAEDHLTVTAPDGVRVSIQVGGPKSLTLRIHGRGLEPGERITLKLGDTSGGGPGSRAQTFLEARHDFLFEVDVKGDGNAVLLADSPRVTIVGGPAERLVLVAPSSVVVGEPFRLIVKAEDGWGNSSSCFRGVVELSGDGINFLDRTVSFDDCSDLPPMQRGVRSIEGLIAKHSGVLRVVAAVPESDLAARSNPIMATAAAGQYQLQWADPHGGQIGSAAKIGDFFRYARDVSGVQFVGYQRNADVISAEDWAVQQAAEKELHELNRFIPIPGYEWSGRTPEGGHHNVYLRRHDQPVRRNPPAEAPQSIDTETELPHIRDVYDAYRNTDTIITPHVGGEHSNLNWHEPTLEPAMEISSSHGSFEWAIREIIERGYQLGFLGGSDCYTGRPGDDRPGHQLRRYAKSGLTGIYTRAVTLDAFFEAMRARRVYATTGARIVLHIQADGNWLGSKYTTSVPPRLTVNVAGTAPLQSVEIYRGLERVCSHRFEQEQAPNRIRVTWDGASRMSSYSGIVWDGSLTVDGASVESARSLRFDSPRSFFRLPDGNNVSWHAWGCGYPMGLLIDLDGDDAELQIAVTSQAITGPMYGGHGEAGGPRRISFAPADRISLSTSLRDLRAGSVDLPLGILDRRISVSLDHAPGVETAQFDFRDEDVEPGVNPYWIRVVQSDLEMAWSSPIYVDYSPT